MKNHKLVSILVVFFIMGFFLVTFYRKNPAVLSEKNVTASASIGVLQSYSLFGYTSSYAKVKLEGIRLSQETQARGKDGYFEFTNFLAPSDIKEFCLTSIDSENLSSPSVCVPVPSQRSGSMGPYLLPPSIQLSTANTKIDTSVIISGKTIPNTSLTLEVFQAQPSLSLIKNAWAQSRGPLLSRSTKSTTDGAYTYRYQSSQEAHVRIFTKSNYLGSSTPKSNTLGLDIIGWFTALLLLLFNFLSGLFNPTTLIILETALVAYLLYRRFFFARRSPSEGRALLVVNRELMIYPPRPLLTFRNFTPIAIQTQP